MGGDQAQNKGKGLELMTSFIRSRGKTQLKNRRKTKNKKRRVFLGDSALSPKGGGYFG